MNNKIHSSKNWEILLYNAVLDYCREKFNIGYNVTVELKFIKSGTKYTGDIGLLSPKNIIKVEDSGITSTIRYILHEFIHIKQKLKKELTTEKSMLLWKGNPIISVKDYKKITYEQHKNLPWEREANLNRELVSNFYKSKYFLNLKGKDANIDFILMTGGI